MRLFVGLSLPDNIKDDLIDLMPNYIDGADVVALNNLHITLCFLGETNPKTYEEIIDALTHIKISPINLSIQGVDFFGTKKFPKILWAKVIADHALFKLQQKIVNAIDRIKININIDYKKFIPHVTMARLSSKTPYEQVGQYIVEHALFKSVEFTVNDFHLYSSIRTKNGPVYQIEQSFY